jgi:hypothetical protein
MRAPFYSPAATWTDDDTSFARTARVDVAGAVRKYGFK